MRAIILVTLLCISCSSTVEVMNGSKVETIEVPFNTSTTEQVISSKELGTIKKTVECSYAGYCIDCDLGFDGSFDCSPKLRPHCSGNRQALVKSTELFITITYHLKTGDRISPPTRKIEETVVRYLTSCG